MISKLFWSALWICASYTVVNAASFDCTKASTQNEKTICATPTLSALDEKLAQAYKAAQAMAASPDQLKIDQRAWLKDTKSCNANVECLERAYNTRIGQLVPPASPAPSAPPVAQPGASEAAAGASVPAALASEPDVAASEPAALSAPIGQIPAVAPAPAEAPTFWERAEVKYGAIALGVLLGLALVVWLTRKAIAGAKKGAVLVAQKGEQLKQDLTEKAQQAREAAAEKTSVLAAELAARTKEAAATASTKLQGGLSEAAVKSAPHLQTLKGDLADMKSKVSSEWNAGDLTTKQKAINTWAGFSSRQKIIFSVTSVVIIVLISSFSGGGSKGGRGPSGKDFSDPAFVQRYADRLGPDGFAKCAVAQISISALAARADGGVPANFASVNEGLGIVLANVRRVLLGKNYPQSYLDNLFKAYGMRITSGDEAARIVNECLQLAGST